MVNLVVVASTTIQLHFGTKRVSLVDYHRHMNHQSFVLPVQTIDTASLTKDGRRYSHVTSSSFPIKPIRFLRDTNFHLKAELSIF
jgi:hypothetical protein